MARRSGLLLPANSTCHPQPCALLSMTWELSVPGSVPRSSEESMPDSGRASRQSHRCPSRCPTGTWHGNSNVLFRFRAPRSTVFLLRQSANCAPWGAAYRRPVRKRHDVQTTVLSSRWRRDRSCCPRNTSSDRAGPSALLSTIPAHPEPHANGHSIRLIDIGSSRHIFL